MERRTFEVGVEHFDGPIDLLLHLVKSRELEISRISLAQVASQYLAYVEMMKGEELEVAAEYLVVAATLLSIKASFLLKQPSEFAEEEDSLPDPQKELLARLREAEIYKDGAEALGAVKQLG
ncbi:MAG: segregation/condensation protein A, partial [Candidatus Dadabacteria bacterium]